MKRLRTRAILLVAVSVILPLGLLGALALYQGGKTMLEEVSAANSDTARRAANEIDLHVNKYEEMLRRLSRTLAPATHLSARQAERILKDLRIDVRALRTVDYVGRDGMEIATGRVDGRVRDRMAEIAVQKALHGIAYRSPVQISDDLLPEITLAEPQRSAGEVVGAIVARVDITEMWTVIDQIRVGKTGYARVVGEDGALIAIGNNALKRQVFSHEKDTSGSIVAEVLRGRTLVTRYTGLDGREVLAVGQPIGDLGWGLILEQPIAEAFAPLRRFSYALIAISVLLLGLAAVTGLAGARSVVVPIEALRVRAGEIAQGLLDKRVEIQSAEELTALAEAMNSMCSDLIRLQDDVRKKERIATLGRLAAGLAHDLKHPVRALQMNARLILDKPDDPEVRRVFGNVVNREFRKLERFLDDLKRASKDEPMEIVRQDIDAAAMLRDFARELQNGNAPAGVEVVVDESTVEARVVGSRDLLERVLSNIASNAFEAMEGEGKLTLATAWQNGSVEIRIADTGCGIPPERVQGLFNDFATTKRRGLGLGLAVCKKIVVDHGGTIAVHSEVGRGTEFRIRLPRVEGAS